MSISVSTGLRWVEGTILVCCCASLCTGGSSNSNSKQGSRLENRGNENRDDEGRERVKRRRRITGAVSKIIHSQSHYSLLILNTCSTSSYTDDIWKSYYRDGNRKRKINDAHI